MADPIEFINRRLDKYNAGKETFCARVVERALQNNGIETTRRFSALLKLLQVPEINEVIYGKMIKCKYTFKETIEEFFKESDSP